MCVADRADNCNAAPSADKRLEQASNCPLHIHYTSRKGAVEALLAVWKVYTDSSMATEVNGEYGHPFFVGKKNDLIQAKRSCITVGDRDIVIIHHQGIFYAMDQHCYHGDKDAVFQMLLVIPNSKTIPALRQILSLDAGGSLVNGDIEEIDSKLCIVCPKHKYKISLAEGEGLYKASNPKDKGQPPRWYSKGIKQRVHQVTEMDGDVFVTLSEHPKWIESDYYQGEKGREELKKTLELEKKKKSNC